MSQWREPNRKSYAKNKSRVWTNKKYIPKNLALNKNEEHEQIWWIHQKILGEKGVVTKNYRKQLKISW